MYPQIEDYDKDRWLNEALKFERDASEIPEPDALSDLQTSRPRFPEISVRDPNAHWFRFQEAAKRHLGAMLSSVTVI